MIHFYRVSKHYPGGQRALDEVTFQLDRGEFAFLTGPSGAGKSTLLRLIFRQEIPTSGQILVNGRNVASLPRRKVPFLRRTMGVVFQDFRLIPRKTVFENVSYLPRVLGLDGQRQKRLAYETLRRVGLAHRMKAFPLELSGGEQQRVAIARATAPRPALIFADEPTGNLDAATGASIMDLLFDRQCETGATLFIITHDAALASRCGRIVEMRDGVIHSDQRAG